MLALFFIYLLKSAICLLVFSLFFRLLLLSDTFVRFSRIVLLCGLVLCLTLPLVQMKVETPTAYQQPIQYMENAITTATEETLTAEKTPILSEENAEFSLPDEPQHKIWHSYMFWILLIYAVGILVFSGRLLYSFYKVFSIIRKGKTVVFEGQKIRVVEREISAFSFFHFIVLSRKDFNENPQEIITHEQMHSRYLHSIDALFVELLLVVQWCNVGLWSLRNDLRALHEYEADRGVLKTGIDATKYQLLLVKKAVGERCFTSVANSFNHSLIKNRITMMLKKETQWWQRLKVVLVVPMAMGMLYAFAQPAVVETMDNVQQDVVEVTEEPMLNRAMKVWNYIVEFNYSKDRIITEYEKKGGTFFYIDNNKDLIFHNRNYSKNFDKKELIKEICNVFYKKYKSLNRIPHIITIHNRFNNTKTAIKITDAILEGYNDAITKISKETGEDYEEVSYKNPLLIVYNKHPSWWLPSPPPPPGTKRKYNKSKYKKKEPINITEIIERENPLKSQCHFISTSDNGKIYMATNFPVEILREFLKPERNSLKDLRSFNMYLGKSDTVKMETVSEVKNLLRQNGRLKMTYSPLNPQKTIFKLPSEKSSAVNTPQGLPIAKSAIKRTSTYGTRKHPIYNVYKMHTGIDYVAKTGTPIIATANGTVITAKSDKKGYGNHIIIKHNDEIKTLYAHLQDLKVKQGQTVKKGQVIGTVGSSGMSTAPHLHYEIRKNGAHVNPANYMK